MKTHFYTFTFEHLLKITCMYVKNGNNNPSTKVSCNTRKTTNKTNTYHTCK